MGFLRWKIVENLNYLKIRIWKTTWKLEFGDILFKIKGEGMKQWQTYSQDLESGWLGMYLDNIGNQELIVGISNVSKLKIN